MTVIGKMLIGNSLKKSVKRFEHELSIKKDVLQADLSLFACHQNLVVSNFEEKKFTALEEIYKAVISTSNARVNFKQFDNLNQESDEEKFVSEYFEAYSYTFEAYDRAFKSVTAAYRVLEDNAIYVDSDLEQEVIDCLASILDCYNQFHNELQVSHGFSQKLLKECKLNKYNAPFDFKDFYQRSSSNWKAKANPTRHKLKQFVREIMTPKSRGIGVKGSGSEGDS